MADAARVALAFIGPDGQGVVREFDAPPDGLDVRALLGLAAASGVLPADSSGCRLAVFGRPVGPDAWLEPGARLELLPALQVDPKLARQRRVEVARRRAAAQGRGDRWRLRNG